MQHQSDHQNADQSLKSAIANGAGVICTTLFLIAFAAMGGALFVSLGGFLSAASGDVVALFP
jgi:hypothetical protein